MAPEARNLLRRLLIDAGINGIRQRDLTYKMSHTATVAEFMPTLAEWRKKGAVQKFWLPSSGGRPTVIWRATELILDVSVYASFKLKRAEEEREDFNQNRDELRKELESDD